MLKNRSAPDAIVIPELAYDDVGKAAEWLCDKFGFQERLRIGNHRVQLVFGSGALIVTGRRKSSSGHDASSKTPCDSNHSVMVRVEDVDRHHARAVQGGVRIIRPPATHPYGERQYTAEDFGGHIWTFTQTIADVDPASWGGTLPVTGA